MNAALPDALDRMPRPALAGLGVLCAGFGTVFAVLPLVSLTALATVLAVGFVLAGVAEVLDAPRSLVPGVARGIGSGWLAAAAAVVVAPGFAMRALPVAVAVGLAVSGLATAGAGMSRAAGWRRVAAVLGGLAGVAFGGLALCWPDVVLFAAGVVLGVRIALFGVRVVARAVRRRGHRRHRARAATGGRVRTLRAATSMAVAVALLLATAGLSLASPRPGAFYQPPSDPPAAPGRLLRAEPFDGNVPVGARAWRILYTTTTAASAPAVASGLVLAAVDLPAGPRPVIAWAHGTTGDGPGCAPSLLATPFDGGAIPAVEQIVAGGVVLVAPDYTGLGTPGPHPYLIGPGEARSVLDAVRAARAITDLRLSGDVVVWGHSQGGHAALWAGAIAAAYAPDLRIGGVVALAPAADLVALVRNLDAVPGGEIFSSFLIASYADTYPDVGFDAYVRPAAQEVVRAMAGRCLFEPRSYVSLYSGRLLGGSIWSRPPADGVFGERLRQNTPTGPFPMPVLIAQGAADQLVLPAAQAAYVRQRCADGAKIDYRTYAGLDHSGVVAPGSPAVPELVAWTTERFTARPARSTCAR